MASKKIGKGGYMVLRPDSGDPTEAVLMVGMSNWFEVTLEPLIHLHLKCLNRLL